MKIGRAKVSNLRKLFQSCIKTVDIAEPLYVANADEDVLQVKAIMDKHDYHVAGIKEGKKVIGYLKRDKLKKGTSRDYITPFKESDLVEADSPLLFALPRFKTNPHVFGVVRKNVHYIITRSDLQKIPMRMLLFGMLSLMELNLLNLIRKHYPQNQWKSLLSASRIAKAKEVMELRKERNEVMDLADCLQFGDKKKIFIKTPELVVLTNQSTNKLKHFFEDAESLRDNLAHVQDLLAGQSWNELIQLIDDIRMFISQCESMEN